MDIATLQSIWTVLVCLLFVGIVAWAWSSRNSARFEQAARAPLDDDNDLIQEQHQRKEIHHV